MIKLIIYLYSSRLQFIKETSMEDLMNILYGIQDGSIDFDDLEDNHLRSLEKTCHEIINSIQTVIRENNEDITKESL